MGLVKMVIADKTSWWANRILSQEAFPEELRTFAASVAHSLAAFRLACESVTRDVPRPHKLIDEVFRMMGNTDFEPPAEKPILLMYESMAFTGTVYGMLITLKSLLDAHTPLVTKALVPGETLRGFNKGSVNGTPDVPGGRLLNWLQKQSKRQDDVGRQSGELHALFDQAIGQWIGTAVKWRDAIAHHGGLPGLMPMQAPVLRTMKSVRGDEVVGPFMPDGTSVIPYAEQTLAQTVELIGRSLRLLPSVDALRLSAPTLDNSL